MMKFFALVALAVFATANANTAPASITAARASVVAGAAGGDLTLVVTTTAQIATSGTITVTPSAAIFTQDGATTCTPTVVGGTPTFASSTVSGTAGTQLITFTLNGANTDVVAAATAITIVCSDNLAVNALTNVAYTFTVATSGDLTALSAQTGYTLTWTQAGWGSASRGTGATNLMTGKAGGDLTFVFTPTTLLTASGTITLTPSAAIFTQDGATTCTATVTGVTAANSPTFASATVSGTAGTQLITFTLNAANTDVVAADAACTIVCTDNLAVNGAAGAINFGFKTSTDLNPLATQTGYTIVAVTAQWTSAARASVVSGAAGGDLTVIFAPTTALTASGTITLTPSAAIFTQDGATTCTATVTGVTAANSPTFASATVSGTAGTQLITFTLNAANTDVVAADAACTIVCTDNLAVNGAVGASITFSIATSTDATALTGQTGYGPFTAATSAASSTASVSMLTMLALAGVAMRQ